MGLVLFAVLVIFRVMRLHFLSGSPDSKGGDDPQLEPRCFTRA